MGTKTKLWEWESSLQRILQPSKRCSPAKLAGRWFARIKEGKAVLSIFFQDRGEERKESSSCCTFCIKWRSKLLGEIPGWEGGGSCFLPPPTFLFTSLSSPIAGRISKCCRDLGTKPILRWDMDCEGGWGIWLHVIFPTFAVSTDLGATFLKPALERQGVVVSSLCCPGKLKFHWHKKCFLTVPV